MDVNKIIKFLIDDEVEAINGYDRAVSALKDNNAIVKKLTEIRDEEVKHIEELNALIFDYEEIEL